jgi:hypothetical protein
MFIKTSGGRGEAKSFLVLIYNTIFTHDTKRYKTMLEPTVAMYGCQAHFQDGVWASK